MKCCFTLFPDKSIQFHTESTVAVRTVYLQGGKLSFFSYTIYEKKTDANFVFTAPSWSRALISQKR